MEWLPVVQNFGFPAVVTAGMAYSAYQLGRWFLQKCDKIIEVLLPKVASALDKHVEFIETAITSLRGVDTRLEKLSGDTQEILGHLKGKQ